MTNIINIIEHFIILYLLVALVSCDNSEQERREQREIEITSWYQEIKQEYQFDYDFDSLDIEYTIDIQEVTLPKLFFLNDYYRVSDITQANGKIQYLIFRNEHPKNQFLLLQGDRKLQDFIDDERYSTSDASLILRIDSWKKILTKVETEVYPESFDSDDYGVYLEDYEIEYSLVPHGGFIMTGEIIDIVFEP
jgi:hypothetical protein